MKKEKQNEQAVDELMSKMGDFEIARWFALIDGVNMVADMCVEKKLDFNDIDIKPSAIEHYIESTCDIYCRKLQEEKKRKEDRKPTEATVTSSIISQINKASDLVCHN